MFPLQHGACKICNCFNQGDMSDLNKRYKTITCLFKFNAQKDRQVLFVHWPGNMIVVVCIYSSLFKAAGQTDTLIAYEKFSFKG